MRHYSDFFTVADDYCPVMTAAEINKTPDRWLDFYPHTEFEDICKTLLSVLASGTKSVWITGNYGTGKSNAALVIQKLFMDDETRVHHWLNEHATNGLTDCDSLEKDLFARRKDGTLVVYDFNAAGVGPNEGLLVRLEKGIINALNERGMSIPAMSNLDKVIERLKREGANFFKTRDSIQSQLAYLDSSIKTIDQLVAALNKPDSTSKLLDDVERVLHEDSIYLPFDAPMFRMWVKAILKANNLQRIVYLFDEFHPFIEANKEQLKTFEDVTESPGVNRFFLVPVTHMKINAYLAEGSDSARKANDRFYFRELKMPNDTAFRLAKHAMKDVPELSSEWKKAKEELWDSVSALVNKFNGTDDPGRDRFYDILPIHPMAAFLLKHLSEQAKSNQRSFFEYLKGGADGTEFQDFIRAGGPEVANKQFLTVDYLWNYFVNRNDLGLNSEIANIGAFYKQTRDRVFQNQTEDAPELRVLKAVLLFCLLGKLAPGGHDRLKPTVENIELSFKGDGTIADPVGILSDLESQHCFSVANGNISLFTITTVKQEDIEKYRDKFHELLHEKAETKLEEHTKNYRKYSSGRFDIRVSDASHTTLTNINPATRDKYTEKINKDDASVCLWFVVAKDHKEQLSIPQKIDSILTQLKDHRILMFTFPSLSFCHNNKNLWNEYIRQYAQYMSENDSAAKKQIRCSLDELENAWFKDLQRHDAVIKVHQYKNGHVVTTDVSWNTFKDLITGYVRRTLKFNVDHLGFQDPHFGNSSIQAYAKAGMQFTATTGPIGQLVSTLKKSGVTDDENWFTQNSDHPLSAIHTLFVNKFANTVGRGGQQSIRLIYIELQRAPYGLRYNALSAFVLGFCLRDILKKNYQWTNGQLTRPLETDMLEEIIETVVKDDGNNKIGAKEKLICRLSREEKKFIEKVPLIFGATSVADATVESVLKDISIQVEKKSARVPLWVLPEYVRTENDPKADDIETVLNDVCTAFTTSNKGKVEDRVNAVKDAGKIILKDPDIVNVIAGYIKTENFVRSFEIYVDKVNPALADLANSIGDVSHGYCRSILDRCQETAGWLWKQADISREIDDMFCEYEVIHLAKPLCGFNDFVPYESVFDALKTAVTETNHLPKHVIESVYPMLANFLSALQSNGLAQDIKLALQQSFEFIKRLFFDHIKTESLLILKQRLKDVVLEDSDLLGILNTMHGGFGLDETTFLENIKVKIEEFAKQSVVLKIKGEWTRLSGTASPAEWAMNNRMPARYIFGSNYDADDLLKAIEHPETFAALRLTDILDVLKAVTAASIIDCQDALIADDIPARYKKFNISLASLLEFLRGEFGDQPNKWPQHPDLTKFIKSQYKETIAPQIKEKIRDRSAEELKKKLLQLADENPELGLMFFGGLKMAYSLNSYYKLSFSNQNATRVLVYSNNTTAANLLNHHKSKGASVIEVAGCIADDAARLPMPNALMSALDAKIRAVDGRAIVVGIDAYLSLLAEESVTAFMVELRNRIDGNSFNADYLLSEQNKPNFSPRYTESLSVVYIGGDEECLDPLSIEAYSDKWVKSEAAAGYKALLEQLGYYVPSGNHTLVLKDLDGVQAEIGNTVSFILGTREIAERYYGITADLSDAALETLLTKSAESGKTPENYLESLFGVANISIRFALKRLLEMPADDLWSTHIWLLRRRLSSSSYISKVIADDVTHDNLLRKYVVETAVSVLSDISAQQYATERAEALKEIGTNYESLIVEFIGQTRDVDDALRFLNCGTGVERVEILRRASLEDLNYGLPKKYAELFPALADYFSTEFDYGNFETASYFKEYRKLKVSNSITDEFVQLAYDLIVPKTFATRDAMLAELKAESDTALLVVDAMGAEYMPLLLALAKRRGMNIESQAIVDAKLPTETIFNPIKWDDSRTLPEIRSVDNIVHNGAAKHEVCTPERNFAETLRVFETEIMNRIADGLTSFARIVVTADHGASRLAVIARSENKGETLPWDGQPDDWRYSLAPQGVPRPPKLEQEYFPETKKTYWIVRGYNRLPKMGGKLYELHGGASLEERLVPIVVFTRNAATEVPKKLGKKAKAEIVDEFEGLI